MDEHERRCREFLAKMFSKNTVKRKPCFDDLKSDGPCSDPMRECDFLAGLPIPYGDELLVNPFA